MRRAGIAVVLLALLAGCTQAEGTQASPSPTPTALAQVSLVNDPRTLTGPNTAVLTTRQVEQVESTEEPALPVTAASHFPSGDRRVQVTDISRIVAFDLSGSIAATIWGLGLGDRLVARDVSTTFPGTEDLPLVTSEGHAVNAEAVMAAAPSVIITDGSMGPRDVVEQLADTGVPVVFVKNVASYAGAANLATAVAAALGVPDTGKLLAQRIRAEVTQTRAEVARLVPKKVERRLRIAFLYVRANSGVYYLLGSGSGVDDLIDGLGGVDVAEELGWKQMQPLTDEALVAAAPDLILLMTHGLESAGGVDGLLAAKPAISLTPAGERRRLVDMADGDVLSFGPRAAAVLAGLAAAVYSPGRA